MISRLAAGRQQGRLVERVGQVGPGKAGRRLRDLPQVDVRGERLVAGMDFQDRLAAVDVGGVDHHLPVEAAGPQQGAIEDLRPVRGRENDHADVRLEAVHLDQQLVERLLAFVVDRPHVDAALAADGVDLVDEDDAGGVFLGLLEQVADAGGPDADEHLHELAAADREERHMGFAGDGPRQQGLARARRPDQQDALGDFGAERLVALGVLEEVDDFLQLVLGLVAAGHVVEADAGVLVGHELGLALADAHHGLAGHAHPPREEVPDGAEENDGEDPGPQQRREQAGAHAVEFDVGGLQLVDELRVLDADRAELERLVRPAAGRTSFRRRSSFRRRPSFLGRRISSWRPPIACRAGRLRRLVARCVRGMGGSRFRRLIFAGCFSAVCFRPAVSRPSVSGPAVFPCPEPVCLVAAAFGSGVWLDFRGGWLRLGTIVPRISSCSTSQSFTSPWARYCLNWL